MGFDLVSTVREVHLFQVMLIALGQDTAQPQIYTMTQKECRWECNITTLCILSSPRVSEQAFILLDCPGFDIFSELASQRGLCGASLPPCCDMFGGAVLFVIFARGLRMCWIGQTVTQRGCVASPSMCVYVIVLGRCTRTDSPHCSLDWWSIIQFSVLYKAILSSVYILISESQRFKTHFCPTVLAHAEKNHPKTHFSWGQFVTDIA